MFSFFAIEAPASNTRFENTPELSDLCLKIAELRQQNNKLKKKSEGKPGNKAYIKSQVFNLIMEKMDAVIDEFNKQAIESSKKISDLLIFTIKLKKLLGNYLELHRNILDVPLDSKKTIAKHAVENTAFVGGVTAGVVTGSFMVGYLASCPAAKLLSEGVLQATGLDDKRTRSVQLLEETLEKLEAIQTALEFVTTDLQADKQITATLPLVCPITNEKMKNPVLCTLDGRLYEKEAIVKWLTEHRDSPFNRKKLEEKQSPDDALVDNFSLREAIQELEMQFKKSIQSGEAGKDDRKEFKM